MSYSLRNHFLIATPGLKDPLFGKSLTYICDHSADGAMGLIINRPMDIKLGHVLTQMGLESTIEVGHDDPILAGGPVHTQRGFVLHPPGDKQWDSSITITPEVALTASKDIVSAIAAGEGPHTSQFLLGYAGWGAGQLEQELKENSWLTVPANADILFETPIERRWHAAAELLGVDINLIPTQAGNA